MEKMMSDMRASGMGGGMSMYNRDDIEDMQKSGNIPGMNDEGDEDDEDPYRGTGGIGGMNEDMYGDMGNERDSQQSPSDYEF